MAAAIDNEWLQVYHNGKRRGWIARRSYTRMYRDAQDSCRPTQEASQGAEQGIQASQVQAGPVHLAGQAAWQPAEPGEPDPGRVSPARESTF